VAIHPQVVNAASAVADFQDLQAWLADHVDGFVPPLGLAQIGGGYSNITYAVSDAAGSRWVLRHPPRGRPADPTAHDVLREARILRALAGTAVPVPEVMALAADGAVLGVPFYLMSFVEGEIIRGPADASRLDPAARAAVGDALIDTLTAVHAVDIDACGLGQLGRREAHVERQLWRFGRQLDSVDDPGTTVARLLRAVHARLTDEVPPQQAVSLVHGDYRLDNAVVSARGHVRAVLDWELAALGDPLVDVGMFSVYWREPREDDFGLAMPTAAPGFAARAELIERYAARTGLDLDRMPYYEALSQWKLACINLGVAQRVRAGLIHRGDAGAILESARRRAEHAWSLLAKPRTA
jgi:aminoglycoside phosphotransferase (APT) family kinase protein